MNEIDILTDIAYIESRRELGHDLTAAELDELTRLYEQLNAVRGDA